QLQLSDSKPNTDLSPKAQVVRDVLELFDEVRASLPTTLNKKAADTIAMFEKEVNELGQPRTSDIGWTQATWNPLHGCQWKSAGCDHCYAAKQMATRLKHRYPGLAEARIVKERKGYFFTNKILLDPKDLAEPLADKTPKRYFVNSMSDLFHEGVQEDFINAVFDVMERAWWHQYQVLTKRPERMAAYSQKRYAHREPPPHIWLGATTENQDAFDQRIKHLAETKTAVRWLSCEPLLGPINLGNKKQVDWIVVGGESGSNRKMEKEWATSLRDQCKKLEISFFFKQWGDYNEQGVKAKMEQADFRILPTLEGAVHGDYPMEIDLIAIERTANPRGPAGSTETMAAMLSSSPRASVR
ncbi:MAG: phage Gp37/Gp68 family protein, partial [Limisphaerales bacterium]